MYFTLNGNLSSLTTRLSCRYYCADFVSRLAFVRLGQEGESKPQRNVHLQATSSGQCKSCLCRPLVHRGCLPSRHAPRSGRSHIHTSASQSESATVQTNSATSPDDSAVPVVSENASAEVPHSEVASQEDLEAAQQKTQAGPTDPAGINGSAGSNGSSDRNEQRQAPQGGRGSMPGRSGGRTARRPRTVRQEQLVQGAEFEGNVVRQLQLGAQFAGTQCECISPLLSIVVSR